MTDALPDGWVSAQVGQVIEDARSGFASGEKTVKGGVAHLRMNNIGLRGELVLDLIRTVPPEAAGQHYDLNKGEVLVCTTNSGKLVGKCAYFDLPGRYAFSNHLTRLRPRTSILDGRLLRWSLWLHWKSGAFDDRCKHWVNQSTIPKDALLEAELAIPPINEQKRILAQLEKLLAKVDSCQTRSAKIPVLLKRFRQAILAAACSGRLTADWRETASIKDLAASEPANPSALLAVEEILETPKSWRWVPLESICDPSRAICYGVIKLGPDREGGIPCLRTSDVKPLRIDTANVKCIASEISDAYRRTLLRGGEVLVNVRGTLGGVAVVQPALRGWNISREIALVPILHVLAEYINFWVASLPCQNWLTGVAKGVAYTGINIQDLRVLPVSLPSPAEQTEIVRRVQSLFALADQLEARYFKAKTHVDKLTQSILAKAFRGELVPQDPNDEPASALLERIKSQSAASAGKVKSERKS